MQKLGKQIGFVAALSAILAVGWYLWQTKAKPASHRDSQSDAPAASASKPRYVHSNHPIDAGDQLAPRPVLPALPRQKVEDYLNRHHRNAASLLAAYRALNDTNYLYEAATNFPNDPRLQCAVLARNLFPEDRRKWLDQFKASSPSNSLANYLSADDEFKNKQPDAALKDLQAASGKSQFQDYSMETILNSEDLCRFSGSSSPDTQTICMSGMANDLLPEIADMKNVAVGIRDMEQQYASSGDSASVQNLAQMGLEMANQLDSGDDGKFIISQLVSMATTAVVLESLDQNTPYDFLNGETPAQRSADLQQEKASIKALVSNRNSMYPYMSEDQMAAYWERKIIYGEIPAMQWLQQQGAATPNTGN